jgi:hypothetical protein
MDGPKVSNFLATSNKLHPHIAEIMKDYCGTLNVKAIRANLFLVHELLEENLDFGIFQCLNTSDLRTLGLSVLCLIRISSVFD